MDICNWKRAYHGVHLMPLFRKQAVTVAEEGTDQGSVSRVDFVGTSTTVTVSGNTATVNSSGGGSGATQGAVLATSTRQDMP